MAANIIQGERTGWFASPIWLNSGILHLNQDGWLTVCNELALQLLDIDVELGVPVRLDDHLSVDREEYKLLHHIVTSRAEIRNEITTWAENKRIRHVLIDSYSDDSVDLGHGCRRGHGMYVMMKDLGDFALLDQHLQRTEKLAVIGKVAAGVAHEIRNPLTTVRGFLQVMMNRFEERQMLEEQEYLQMMVAEVDKVESLVKELLLLSKPHHTAKRNCKLGKLVTALRPSIEVMADTKQISTEFVIDETIPSVAGDEGLLTHVVNQLVENAIDAMEPKGHLTVRVYSEDKVVRLDVRDTGPGIPYYQMDQVFDAFFTTKEKGTGLGLPICQKIVADHGGDIHVSSKGFGTTFSVLLPALEAKRPEQSV
ncbi:two-component system sensor histidine kinase NtrB [Alicyclobacillus ferrooxydans]|uniref:histidine kinase n=1 Tax=Alicyclobacillus ferrooxydans TaxID=471514 RepID=A0A0P9CP37_9BACL|nr:ATP-binding protein [Alicyclobacillus ferrooxydans]KPV44626.1 hypothetical protein AN477_06490 [Alicyclobacillus ferrooxydans]